MRRSMVLLYAALFALIAVPAFAGGGDGEEEQSDAETLRRSQFERGSYPIGPITKAPLATGYYVTDNDAPISGAPWQPSYEFFDTTGSNLAAWRRIRSGANQGITTTPFGEEYFRNPNNPSDSTDDALAGPISIGFPFYYYGIKYDSFYVSTNGLVALSNRRYVYDLAGQRVGYDQFSDDVRPRSGNPATDPVPDDYGFQYVALNNDNNDRRAGILNPNNTPLPNANLRSTLAPMWDDLELSQNDDQGIPLDFGRVYWRLADNANKLVIYYVRVSMPGDVIKNIPVINHQHRLNEDEDAGDRAIRTNFQVVLDRRDSSVQYNYIRFDGEFLDPEQGIFRVPSAALFRANSTIGVQSHDREATNYLFSFPAGENGAAGGVYVNGVANDTPHPGLAIQFKQWKNVVRVLEVSFQRPDPDNPAIFESLDRRLKADNYELLLGHPILGVIRPVGIVENVSSDVGPVNVTAQPIRFNVVFRIQDLVFTTRPPVYQKSSTTQALYPIENQAGEQNANVNRPNIDTIIFNAYNPNPTVVKNVGRFKAEIIATDRGPNGVVYGDRWPFDDTTGVRIFGIRRVELPYITTFDNYNLSQDGIVPDVTNWVSIGAEVVDGESATYNPPPPRTQNVGPSFYNSPVAKLDRRNIGGAFYNADAPGVWGGDTLISFPINLAGGDLSRNPAILFSYERAGRQTYPRGWSDQTRLGPEQAVYNTLKTGFYQFPDHLLVEFAEPSTDIDTWINNVTNVRRWSESGFLSEEGSVPAKTYFGSVGSPRFAVFGGGGGSDTSGNIVIDEFDGGKDFLFRRAIVPIPRRWTSNVDVAKYFRFRLRAFTMSHKNPVGPPADDEDPFYVDNIIVSIADKPEVEVTGISIDWPYTEAPASQARAIPMSVKVSNNGTTAATAFGVALSVVNADTPPPPGNFNYYRYKTIISLGAGEDDIQAFPSWNAQECGADIEAEDSTSVTTEYRITAQILPAGYDSYNANDITFTDFELRLGPTFAYEQIDSRGNVTNDISQVSGTFGRGLTLSAAYPDAGGAQPYGPTGGSFSGMFASQFRILTRDTIRGFQAYYGSANSSADNVMYVIYKQRAGSSANAAPAVVAEDPKIGFVEATRTYARRGEGDPADPNTRKPGPFYYNEYVIYELDSAYVVDPGIYFVGVAQLGQTGIELGGNGYRQGQVITVYDPAGAGAGNVNVAGHPEFRNSTRFWYETSVESDSWSPMLTTIGNPGYPHLNIAGQNPMGFPTWQRGSWIPMIRPYFGYKSSSSCEVLPVELNDFRATALTSAIRLDWQTATELNNHGFNVERREAGNESWNDLTFVEGAGTSNQVRDYSHVDQAVEAGTTYQYRLRQEDLDGTISYSGVREARIDAATAGSALNSLGLNTPNPAADGTTIPFVVAESGVVSLEISDVYGNVVRTIAVETRGGENNSISWDLTDAEGAPVANGTYIYKLVGNGFTQSRKMTVIR